MIKLLKDKLYQKRKIRRTVKKENKIENGKRIKIKQTLKKIRGENCKIDEYNDDKLARRKIRRNGKRKCKGKKIQRETIKN